MNTIPVRTIARRELTEMITDWRLCIPLMVLTFLVPLFVVVIAIFLMRSPIDSDTIHSLTPIALLLCGFLPAGFSLVNASESFVGEKERKTLECLLSTPMSDQELYLGKLIATLIPPIISSLLAMMTFAGLFLLQAPTIATEQLTASLFGLIVLAVIAKAMVMAAAAQLISMRSTTVRAANLLASFLLIPMAFVVEIEALLISTGNFTPLLLIPLILFGITVMLVRRGLVTFNREAILARDHPRLNSKRMRRTFMRYLSQYHPAGTTLDHYQEGFSFARFYRYDFGRLLQDYRLALLATLLMVIAGLFVGAWAFSHPGYTWIGAPDPLLQHLAQPWPEIAQQHLVTNLRTILIAAILSLASCGVAALGATLILAAHISYAALWEITRTTPAQPVLLYLLPQALFTLPGIALGSALGLRIGLALLYAPRGISAGQHLLWSLANFVKVFCLILIPLFLLSAICEGWLIPLIAPWIIGS